MVQSSAERSPDRRASLGVFDIACVVVGGIIGVGIFFTPQTVAARVDNVEQLVVAWSLGGMIAVLGGLVFAELSRRVPGHGGTFTYLHRAFGPLPAFLYGWTNWLVVQAGALGVIGLILVDNLDVVLYGEGRTSEGVKVVCAALAILLFTAINAAGLRFGRGVQNVLTVAKALAILGLVVLAMLTFGGGESAEIVPVAEQPRGWLRALGGAMLPVLFSFGGWQQGSFLAGAARRPSRDVPLGLLFGVGAVVAAYVAANFAYLQILGFEGARQADAIGADAARVALEPYGHGNLGARALAAMICVSAAGILNTICLAPPYVLHSMAKRGLFLESVGRLSASGTPVIGVLVQGLWGVGLLVVVHLGFGRDTLYMLADGIVFADWMFFSLVGLALLKLRRAGVGGNEGFRVPAGQFVAVLFSLCAVAIMLGAVVVSPLPALAGAVLVLLGWPVYVGFSKRNQSAGGPPEDRTSEDGVSDPDSDR